MRKKIIISVVVLLVLIPCIYFPYYWYDNYRFIKNVTPLVKNISVRTTVSSGYFFEGEMTFIELFSRLDENIKEIDNKIIDIKTIAGSHDINLINLILEYANISKSILRIEREYFRQRLEQKTLSSLTDKYIKDLRSDNSFLRDYARGEIDNHIKKLKELQSETDLNMNALVSAIEKLYGIRSHLLDYFDATDLVETKTLDKIYKLHGMNTSAPAENGAESSARRVKKVALRNIQQYVVMNKKAGPLFVIEGKAVNTFEGPKERIRVGGTLYDDRGNTLATKQVLCGNTLSRLQLENQTEEEITTGLSSEVGVLSNNTDLKTGRDTPFMVVFFNPPKNVKEYGINVIDALDPAQ